MMIVKQHWHKYNPWADSVVYVPIHELAACHHHVGQVLYNGGKREIMTIGYILDMWLQDGLKVDAYILPSPSGDHCIGIRYGKEGSQYLSPMGDQKKVQKLLNKYRR
jgi:hypothetical protein